MSTDTKLSTLIINKLSKEQYSQITPNANELYLVPEDFDPDDLADVAFSGDYNDLINKPEVKEDHAEVQYKPFSINNGAKNNDGYNNTLTTAGGTASTVTVVRNVVPVMNSNSEQGVTVSVTGSNWNNTIPYKVTQSGATGWYSAYGAGGGATFTFTLEESIPANSSCTFTVTGNGAYTTGVTLKFNYTDSTDETVWSTNNLGSNTANPTVTAAKAVSSIVLLVGGNSATSSQSLCRTYLGNFNLTATYTESVSSADTLICNPCTITTADSKSKTFTGAETLDCSTAVDGTYKVLKSYNDGSLSLASSLPIQKTAPTSPNADDLWFDNSQFPLAFKKYVAPNYTVNGTPTITENGIYTATAVSDWVLTDTFSVSGSSVEIDCEFVYHTVLANRAIWWANTNARVMIISNGAVSIYALNSYFQVENDNFQNGDIVRVRFIYESSTSFKYECYVNGTLVKTETETLSVTLSNITSAYIGGWTNNVSGYTEGSIDLKEFKVFVDGALIYQPAIPNGWVKNDNVYIGDVTVSSGLITDINNRYFNACPALRYIVDTYQNGASGYAIYSDGWCEQWGACTSGTAVVLEKSYKDTNYTLSITYSAKTATGFTPSATGDYIAKGFIE